MVGFCRTLGRFPAPAPPAASCRESLAVYGLFSPLSVVSCSGSLQTWLLLTGSVLFSLVFCWPEMACFSLVFAIWLRCSVGCLPSLSNLSLLPRWKVVHDLGCRPVLLPALWPSFFSEMDAYGVSGSTFSYKSAVVQRFWAPTMPILVSRPGALWRAAVFGPAGPCYPFLPHFSARFSPTFLARKSLLLCPVLQESSSCSGARYAQIQIRGGFGSVDARAWCGFCPSCWTPPVRRIADLRVGDLTFARTFRGPPTFQPWRRGALRPNYAQGIMFNGWRVLQSAWNYRRIS